MVAAAVNGLGVALAPSVMFARELTAERLVQPFDVAIDAGRYWLTRLLSRKESDTMRAFRSWLLNEITVEEE
jgi:LysR family transcriptional regulator of beta-lactamase